MRCSCFCLGSCGLPRQDPVLLIQRLSRPSVGVLGRDPESGAWGRADRHPGWVRPAKALALRPDGPLLFANAGSVREQTLAAVRTTAPRVGVVVLDLGVNDDLDVETVDMLSALQQELAAAGASLRLANVHAYALERLRRSRLADRVTISPTLDAAVEV